MDEPERPMKLTIEEAKNRNPDGRLFECGPYKLWVPKHCCFFCQHLTDALWDYTNGPYFVACECDPDPAAIERGMKGECPSFKEEDEKHA